MAYEFKVTRRVEFCETDMAGIMHFSNYIRFLETAEHAFYRSLGFSVFHTQASPVISFPRVHVSCDYFKPLRFEDIVEIHLLVREIRAKTISYNFRFRNLSASPPVEVARANLTIVCVSHEANRAMKSVPIPPEIASQIQPAPAALLGNAQ